MKKDGGPAFPTKAEFKSYEGNTAHVQFQGMSLRDYFAAKAMQSRYTLRGFDEAIAKESYEMADAMLAERAALAKDKP